MKNDKKGIPIKNLNRRQKNALIYYLIHWLEVDPKEINKNEDMGLNEFLRHCGVTSMYCDKFYNKILTESVSDRLIMRKQDTLEFGFVRRSEPERLVMISDKSEYLLDYGIADNQPDLMEHVTRGLEMDGWSVFDGLDTKDFILLSRIVWAD